MSNDEIRKITLEEFKQQPLIYVSSASRMNGRNPNDGPAVTILLTNCFHHKVGNVTRTENLAKYEKNRTALNKAIDRVFQAAATGKTIGMKVQNYDGARTAYAYRADC